MGGLMVALPVLASAAASTSLSGAYCVASASGSTTVQRFSTFGASISYATGGLVNLSNANVACYVSRFNEHSTTTRSAGHVVVEGVVTRGMWLNDEPIAPHTPTTGTVPRHTETASERIAVACNCLSRGCECRGAPAHTLLLALRALWRGSSSCARASD